MPVELELEIAGPFFDERNHPNPSFKGGAHDSLVLG